MSTTAYNRTILSGNLTADPESRRVKAGEREVSVCDFSIAVDRPRSKGVDFFEVTAWRELADIVARHKKKGDGILLEGRLQHSRWTDESGAVHSKVKVVAEAVRFLEGAKTRSAKGGRRGAVGDQAA